MTIKIELIIFFLGLFVTVLTAVISWVAKVVVKCTEAIDAIHITLAKMGERNLSENKECRLKHTYVSEKINNHEKRIVKLESK